MAGKERQPRPKQLAQDKTHQVKNFAWLASKMDLPKSDGLQNQFAKTHAERSHKIYREVSLTKGCEQAMDTAQAYDFRQNEKA